MNEWVSHLVMTISPAIVLMPGLQSRKGSKPFVWSLSHTVCLWLFLQQSLLWLVVHIYHLKPWLGGRVNITIRAINFLFAELWWRKLLFVGGPKQWYFLLKWCHFTKILPHLYNDSHWPSSGKRNAACQDWESTWGSILMNREKWLGSDNYPSCLKKLCCLDPRCPCLQYYFLNLLVSHAFPPSSCDKLSVLL